MWAWRGSQRLPSWARGAVSVRGPSRLAVVAVVEREVLAEAFVGRVRGLFGFGAGVEAI